MSQQQSGHRMLQKVVNDRFMVVISGRLVVIILYLGVIMPCDHDKFEAKVLVNRLVDARQYMLEVSVKCVMCGEDFVFIGLPLGVNLGHPTSSVSGLEARMPIQPASAGLN